MFCARQHLSVFLGIKIRLKPILFVSFSTS